MGKDIAPTMQYVGKEIAKCDHFCKNKIKNTIFYNWFTYLDGEFIKKMCELCALREIWGYNYKQTKGYKNWIG